MPRTAPTLLFYRGRVNSSRQTPSPLLALLVASAISLVPLPATAFSLDAPEATEEDDNRTRAMEAYRRGTELYNAAEFEEALASFEEAATLYASPDFQFNIGKCYERLGKHEQAVHHYKTYLRTSEDPPDRAVVENSISDLEARIAADAEAEEKARQLEVAPPPEPAEPPPSGKPLVIAGGALLGVGLGVGLGGGLGFGLPVNRDNATLGEVLDNNPEQLTFAEAEDLAARARTNQTLEFVMIGMGGALVVTGAALLALGVKRNKARAAATSEAAASLRAAPSWIRGGAGLTLQGQF